MEPADRGSSGGGSVTQYHVSFDSHVTKMQSMAKSAMTSSDRPAKLTIGNTLAYIYRNNGIRGLYRGVTPRIGLGVWQTICMVSFADYVKIW